MKEGDLVRLRAGDADVSVGSTGMVLVVSEVTDSSGSRMVAAVRLDDGRWISGSPAEAWEVFAPREPRRPPKEGR
jgi:hypothetical protein